MFWGRQKGVFAPAGALRQMLRPGSKTTFFFEKKNVAWQSAKMPEDKTKLWHRFEATLRQLEAILANLTASFWAYLGRFRDP